MTEQLLNVAWLSIAIASFAAVVPSVERRHRLRAAIILAGVLALLFPIISISDDLSADWSAQEIVAVLFAITGLVVVFSAMRRFAAAAPQLVSLETIDLSDPRSPPRV